MPLFTKYPHVLEVKSSVNRKIIIAGRLEMHYLNHTDRRPVFFSAASFRAAWPHELPGDRTPFKITRIFHPLFHNSIDGNFSIAYFVERFFQLFRIGILI